VIRFRLKDSLPKKSRPFKGRAGFTLVEIMVVVVIVGVLAALTTASFNRIRENSQFSVLMNDFRVFASGFQTYMLEFGSWPADRAPGILPPEVEGIIKRHDFESPTPVTGLYDWDPPFNGSSPDQTKAWISVRDHNLSEAQIDKLLERFDDGQRDSGVLQVAAGGTLFYSVD